MQRRHMCTFWAKNTNKLGNTRAALQKYNWQHASVGLICGIDVFSIKPRAGATMLVIILHNFWMWDLLLDFFSGLISWNSGVMTTLHRAYPPSRVLAIPQFPPFMNLRGAFCQWPSFRNEFPSAWRIPPLLRLRSVELRAYSSLVSSAELVFFMFVWKYEEELKWLSPAGAVIVAESQWRELNLSSFG